MGPVPGSGPEPGPPPPGAAWRAAEAALREAGPPAFDRAAAAAPEPPPQPSSSGRSAAVPSADPLGRLLAAAAGPEGVGARRARCREAALLALRAACARLREEGVEVAASPWEALGALGAQALAGPAPEQTAPSERAAALGLVGDALEGDGLRDPGSLLEAALSAGPFLPEPEARRLVRLASERHTDLLSATLREAQGASPGGRPDGDRQCRALALGAALLREASPLPPRMLRDLLPAAAGAWAAAGAVQLPRAEHQAGDLAAALAEASEGGALGFAAAVFGAEADPPTAGLQGLCGDVLLRGIGESPPTAGESSGADPPAPPPELWDFLEAAAPRLCVLEALAASSSDSEGQDRGDERLVTLEAVSRAARLARGRSRPLQPGDGARAFRALAAGLHAVMGWVEVSGLPPPRWSSPQLSRAAVDAVGHLLGLCTSPGAVSSTTVVGVLPAVEQLLRPSLRMIARGEGTASGNEVLAAHTVACCLQVVGGFIPTVLGAAEAHTGGDLGEQESDESPTSWVQTAAKMSLACVSHPATAIRLRGLAAVRGMLERVPPQRLAWSRPLLARELVRALETADAEAWAPAALACAQCLPSLSPGDAGVGSPCYELARSLLRAGEARGGQVRFLSGWIPAAEALFPRLGADAMLHLQRLVPLIAEALRAGGLLASTAQGEGERAAGNGGTSAPPFPAVPGKEAAAACSGAARLLAAVCRQAWPRMHAHAPALRQELAEARSRWEGGAEGLLRDLDEADRALSAVLDAFQGSVRGPAATAPGNGALDWQLQELLDLA